MTKYILIFLLFLPIFLLAQNNENVENILNDEAITFEYNSLFKPLEDSIQFYADIAKQPQLPPDKLKTLQQYNTSVAVFRNRLRSFVAQNSTSDLAAKALLLACFGNDNLTSDTLLSIAEMLAGQGLHNKYADYFYQEIKGRKNNQIGKFFIPFSMTDDKNKIISSDIFKGKYMLVLFWASWCMPCRVEVPDWLALYHQFKKREFEVLAISVESDKKSWLHAIQTDKTDWYNLFDGKAWNTDAARNYAIHTIPQNLLINPEGKIMAKNISTEGLQKILSAQ